MGVIEGSGRHGSFWCVAKRAVACKQRRSQRIEKTPHVRFDCGKCAQHRSQDNGEQGRTAPATRRPVAHVTDLHHCSSERDLLPRVSGMCFAGIPGGVTIRPLTGLCALRPILANGLPFRCLKDYRRGTDPQARRRMFLSSQTYPAVVTAHVPGRADNRCRHGLAVRCWRGCS